ncbi:MAG: cobalamin-dependent protein [Deltaproteobacteria bacterium]|nr:cobalamin-dependent protein [Deltaproteobacteria bacterium]
MLKRWRQLLIDRINLRSEAVGALIRLAESLLPFEHFARLTGLQDLAYDPTRDPAWPSPPVDVPGGGMAASRHQPVPLQRVLLVQPPFALANRRHKKTMPLGLLALGGYLKQQFPELGLDLLDAHITNMAPAQVMAYLRTHPADLVCITGWTGQMPMAYAIADAMRAAGSATVVLGGVHATLCPDEAIEHADYVVVGEGELPLAGLVAALQADDPLRPIDGVISSPGGTTCRQFVPDLDALPDPAWELLPDWKCYDHPLHVVGGFRFPLMGSRGCPFNCTFCSSPLMWQRKVRWLSPARIVAEMEEVRRRYQVNQFHFWDDNLVLMRRHMTELAELILKTDHPYRWVGLSRASDIVKHQDILPLMKRAGCVGLEIGVESFTQVSVDMTRKGEAVEEMVTATDCLIRAGITPLFTHMLFTPGETLAGYPIKEKFIHKLLSGVGLGRRSESELGQLTTPHRGTVFAQEAPALGEVLCRNNADFVHHRVNFIPHSLLDDIPRKTAACPGYPYYFLGTIGGAVYNWTLPDMQDFLKVGAWLWPEIDGRTSIRELSRRVAARFPHLDPEKALIFTSLNLVGWARDDRVTGLPGRA